jgi:hypothetical protein
MYKFALPVSISRLISARNEVRTHYNDLIQQSGGATKLSFTLDGNLVGDIGEALAVELFGIRLVDQRSAEGIDGYTADNLTSVQIKATGTGRGPAFRNTETRAKHLLFFDLDFDRQSGLVVFNGPEHYAVSSLPNRFLGQRQLSARQIRHADALVQPGERLALIKSRIPALQSS